MSSSNRPVPEPVMIAPSSGFQTHFADGAVVEDRGETVRVVFYQDRADGRGSPEHIVTMAFILTRAGFYQSLQAAMASFLPDAGQLPS